MNKGGYEKKVMKEFSKRGYENDKMIEKNI